MSTGDCRGHFKRFFVCLLFCLSDCLACLSVCPSARLCFSVCLFVCLFVSACLSLPVFQGHLPRKLWKFNSIIDAPEYVHSVGRDISLYNWYRNSNHLNIERWRSGHFNSGGKSRACEMQRLGLGSYVAQNAGPDKVGLPKGEKEKVLARVRTHRVGWAGQKFELLHVYRPIHVICQV